MDLLPLEHFIAVVEEGSFSRAAERVFRTQPAVSQSIKKLEQEIGTPLLARDVHEVRLTDAGKVLLNYARRMLQLRDEAVCELSQLRSLNAGVVSIAAHESAALYLLPRAVRRFVKRYPKIKIEIHRTPVDVIPQRVMDRDVDIGFVVAKPPYRELHSVPIYSDNLILVAAPDHPMAQRDKPARLKDLEHESLVVHNLCQSTSRQTLHLFEQKGISVRVTAELSSFESMKAFVAQGMGLAFLPRLTALRELEEGSLVEVPVDGLRIRRRTYVMCRGQRYLSSSARHLFEMTRAPIASLS